MCNLKRRRDTDVDLDDAILVLQAISGSSGEAAINVDSNVDADGKMSLAETIYIL